MELRKKIEARKREKNDLALREKTNSKKSRPNLQLIVSRTEVRV
jgi:hypothetical protein